MIGADDGPPPRGGVSAPRVGASEPATGAGDLPGAARDNLQLVAKFHEREQAAISGMRLAIERISAFFGSPWYFLCCVAFMVIWAVANAWGARAGWHVVDEPPFPFLQGLVSSNALLLTIAVLIRQNRMARLAEHRAHLDLQINLLTEQKAAKILEIVDELHRELVALRGRPDTRLEEMTKPADANALLHAIKEHTPGER
jgi:uncharacterized membrane protein